MSDWIEWTGGKCPILNKAHHQRRYRDGHEDTVKRDYAGADLIWAHFGEPEDIVAYRVVPHD